MLCDNISVNPQKGSLQSLDRGMNKIKKRIFLLTQAFFCPLSWNFTTTRSVFFYVPSHVSLIWKNR